MAKGRFSIDDIREGLSNPELPADFGRSEAEWLTLWSIEHPETPHLCACSNIGFVQPLIAETAPSGRAYRLWANKARGEQDQLHQAAWLAQLNPA